MMRYPSRICQLLFLAILNLRADSSFQLIDNNGNTIVAPKEGLLLYDGGTVCDDSFSDFSATAICKEMGFDEAISWSSGLRWSALQKDLEVGLDDVECPTPDWSSCTYETENNCDHSEDVFLTCKGFTVTCPPGTYRNSRSCRQCPANTFKATEGVQNSCTTCPGSTVSHPGALQCFCRGGMFLNETKCENCPLGTASPEDSIQCFACPSSLAINQGTSCSCPDGMVWDWVDQGFCRSCSSGTYKNSKTLTCAECPTGTTSPVGSDHCVCPAGKFWNDTFCQNCSVGSISRSGASRCITCPIGSKALDHRSCACPDGMVWSWDDNDVGFCKPCPAGTYKTDQMRTCIRCPLDATSTLSSGHCSCRAGMFWNKTRCQRCPQGLVSQGGTLQCMSCPQGSVALNGRSACSCSRGTMWEWTDNMNASCSLCLPGTYKNDLVSSCQACPAGLTSVTGSDHCLCGTGMFWNETRCDNCTEGTVSPRGSLRCLTCPPGSTSEKDRTLCPCPFGKSWSWDNNGVGSCKPASLGLNTGLALICSLGASTLISLTLAIVAVSMTLKKEKDVENQAKVSYIVKSDVEMSYNQGRGLQCSGEDLIVCQPGEEVYNDNIYNCLIKE